MRFKNTCAQDEEDVNHCLFKASKQDASMCTTLTVTLRVSKMRWWLSTNALAPSCKGFALNLVRTPSRHPIYFLCTQISNIMYPNFE